jgi:hypothetical protein
VNSENNNAKIRVLVVDDSAFMRTALSRMVMFDPEGTRTKTSLFLILEL